MARRSLREELHNQDADELEVLLHDAVAHLEAALIKFEDIYSQSVGRLYEAAREWPGEIRTVLDQARELHDELKDPAAPAAETIS